MIVGGVQWTTLLDYPDRIAATVFTSGCNFRCPFCHNPELVLPDLVASSSTDLEESFFKELEARKGFLDAVVISGGEPTLQADLVDVLERVKRYGYLVKLDTNGTLPGLLQRVLANGLVDFVAMDVKAPPERYEKMSGVSVDVAAIERSISVIMRFAAQYEFRTTAGPGLSSDDLLDIGRRLDGARSYWLQKFRAPRNKGLVDEGCRALESLAQADLESVWHQLRGRFDGGGVRS